MLLGGQTTEFHMNAILKATPFACEACESNHSLVTAEKLLEDSRNSSVALFAAMSQVSTWLVCALGRCVGVRQAMTLIGNARQTTSKEKVVRLKPDRRLRP